MSFRTEADLLTAAQSQEAEEGDHLELKRELPAGDAGTREIGKDLAAMALGGGVILVGVDEGPPQVLTPITLAGQRERVEGIARGIDPPVPCEVSVIRKDPPMTGYLVITVPVSDDAPHAHQGRFYGRFGSISAPLKHQEVRRYFEDRLQRSASQRPTPGLSDPPIDRLLDAWMKADPTPEDQRRQAHIFVIARPRQATPQLLEDAVGDEWEAWSRRFIAEGRDRLTPTGRRM
ncbi:MAG: ATP-binding protein [Chloroflexota bacterium]|nr:ATP-binding protein [Chloroflexota bacterium]